MNETIQPGGAKTADVVRTLQTHGPLAIRLGVLAMIVAGVWVGVTMATQDVRRAFVLDFAPAFDGAEAGTYPNGTPFLTSDIVTSGVVVPVLERNEVQEFCPSDVLRTGFYVQRRSDSPTSTEAEPAAAPIELRLLLVVPSACARLPEALAHKLMHDVLTFWATESETRRGVLRQQVRVLTPRLFEMKDVPSPFVRADLLRDGIIKVADNIREVVARPGAEVIRHVEHGVSFAEVMHQLRDLNRVVVDPLVVTAGAATLPGASDWIAESAAAAERESEAADARAAALRLALADYSVPSMPAVGDPAAGPNGMRNGSATLHLDGSVLDRMLAMGAEHAGFRQDLAARAIGAGEQAALARARAAYYQRLAGLIRQPRAVPSLEQIERRLTAATAEAQRLTQVFNDLYDEFSRLTLRSGEHFFRTWGAVQALDDGARGWRWGLLVVAGAFFTVLALTLMVGLLREQLMSGPHPSRE